MALNESLLNMLVSCKGTYVLEIARMLMKVPNVENKFIYMEDLSPAQVKLLHSLLDYLCSPGPDHQSYIVEVEGHLSLQSRHDPATTATTQDRDGGVVVGWGTMWSQILGTTVRLASKNLSTDVCQPTGKDIAKFLPKPVTVCPKNILSDSSPAGANTAEAAESQKGSNANSAGSGGVVTDPKNGQASLHEIYAMHSLGKLVTLNVMNIVAMRATIESHVMSVATQKSGSALLKSIRLDAKNAAILQLESIIDKSPLGERLYAFGTISTEWASKSINVPRFLFRFAVSVISVISVVVFYVFSRQSF